MASVTVRRESLTVDGAEDLPRVCVLSGGPADGTTWFRLSHTPGWTFILLLFGIVPFFVAEYFTTERIKVTLPVARAAVERHERERLVRIGLLLVGALLVGVGAATGWAAMSWGGVLLFLVGVVVWVVISWRMPTWVPTEEIDTVTLRRVHEDFTRAVAATADAAG